ncbi:methyltransferase domain-containing protein [Komarekiella sp. 'clone 1']|uniref:Methyltransferase domain-containing protein n=1 Tax=Komarekiella delphini-convector SJRDD-AB1 TaxID=2593771 RepID=A0AA40STA2_9NOST|nr:methyltransferase domain-containing protein [Komarekiella delphini-convector]MBD6614826.1 methyltransferase domain-containing protein [Komarekiella delphini-convector SJRDD-AB1]
MSTFEEKANSEVTLSKTNKNKLHLGCGRKILEEYVNIDIFPAPGVDLVCDINEGIPFEDNSFSEALAVDFIEHIQPTKAINLMNEVYRVLKPGGIFRIHVPEAPGITAYQDPTHTCFWNEESFSYYIHQHYRREKYGIYYGIIAKFKLISLKRKRHMWQKFFNNLNWNYLTNYLLDIELEAIK